jgi:UPF0755 protein
MEHRTIIYLLGAVLLFGLFAFFVIGPPAQFPVGSTVNIEKGWTLGKVSEILKTNKIIRSRAAFEFFVILTGGEKHIRPAFYTFEKTMPVFEVAFRVSGGRFAFSPVKVTLPEGFNSVEIADAFAKKMPNFDKEQFAALSMGLEGKLFPDTYFFLTTDGAEEAIRAMTENYEEKVSPLRESIAASGHTEHEIITMASIIEGEAAGDLDRALISGILWKRIAIGMPLQADAAPVTYKQRGLPDTPIGNPGLKAIEAAIHPEQSPYLYYLHDKNGTIYYAKNFKEHTENKSKYLK